MEPKRPFKRKSKIEIEIEEKSEGLPIIQDCENGKGNQKDVKTDLHNDSAEGTKLKLEGAV